MPIVAHRPAWVKRSGLLIEWYELGEPDKVVLGVPLWRACPTCREQAERMMQAECLYEVGYDLLGRWHWYCQGMLDWPIARLWAWWALNGGEWQVIGLLNWLYLITRPPVGRAFRWRRDFRPLAAVCGGWQWLRRLLGQ